jgi:hypothetical protein
VTLLRLVLRVVLLAAGQALIGDLHHLRNREQEFNFNGTCCGLYHKKLTLSILKKEWARLAGQEYYTSGLVITHLFIFKIPIN